LFLLLHLIYIKNIDLEIKEVENIEY